jgi:hypothetical protein
MNTSQASFYPAVRLAENPAAQRLLGRIPVQTLSTISGHQIDAIARAVESEPSTHLIDFRASVPLGFMQLYITVLIGRERRRASRLAAEGQLHPVRIVIGYLLLLSLLVSAVLGFAVILYCIKSVLGIDLLPGHSLFHGAYEVLYCR